MLLLLTPHRETPSTAVDRIEVQIRRGEASLSLRYEISGDLARVRAPDLELAGRADALWRHTCFEVFVKPDGGDGYLECNFAGNQWATYRFSGYREGMEEAAVEPGVIEWSVDEGWVLVEIATGRFARPDLPAPDWCVGLSAVIEDIEGGFSYWALTHPEGKPDFHHPDSFALVLPAPEFA
jgi:hypothetical protein